MDVETELAEELAAAIAEFIPRRNRPGADTMIGEEPGMATRDQARKRQDTMRANGPIEAIRVAEIGSRDGWTCGICRDAERPVTAALAYPHPLSPSLDHIQPVASGGPHSARTCRSRTSFETWRRTRALGTVPSTCALC
jgi:hypothetical protein